MALRSGTSAEARFSLNTDGRLATAAMRVTADDFVAAERYAHDLVLPLLSRWSFDHDVAIDVAGYAVVEEATQAKKYRYGATGKVRGLVADPNERIVSTPEHRQLLAAYREGLNASNVFFQVLSFFKVTEGIRHLRTGRAQEARAKGLGAERYVEAVPADFAVVPHDSYTDEGIWRPYLGKKFGAVLKDFEHTKRNAMAHIDPRQQVVLVADKFDDIDACLTILPVLRYIARQMLHNELAHVPGAPS